MSVGTLVLGGHLSRGTNVGGTPVGGTNVTTPNIRPSAILKGYDDYFFSEFYYSLGDLNRKDSGLLELFTKDSDHAKQMCYFQIVL